ASTRDVEQVPVVDEDGVPIAVREQTPQKLAEAFREDLIGARLAPERRHLAEHAAEPGRERPQQERDVARERAHSPQRFGTGGAGKCFERIEVCLQELSNDSVRLLASPLALHPQAGAAFAREVLGERVEQAALARTAFAANERDLH